MFRVLHCIVEPVHYPQGVRQPVSMCIGGVGRQRGRVEGPRAVSAHIVGRNQGGTVHGSAAGVGVVGAVGRHVRRRQRVRERQQPAAPTPAQGVFAVCAGDDGPVHGARQPRPDAVDVGFADVRVEDPLQHDVPRACRVDRQRRVVV